KGIVHEGIGTAAFHWGANAAKMVQPDGLQWVKTSDADVLFVDEDSGNDYGERKFAIVLNPDDLTLKEDGVGHFLAMAGGSKNPRAVNGIAAYPGAFSRATSSEFSGSWNVTALVTKKPDGAFYSIEELAGTGEQAINSSVTLAETTMIGVVQHAGESGGAVAERKADQGGQIFMFNFKDIETNPSVQLNVVGRYVSGEALDTGAAEIVAFDKSTDRLFVINASAATVDVLSVGSTGSLTKIGSIDSSAITGGVSIGGFNSVDAHNGLVAVAVEAATQTDNGSVAFFDASDLSFISSVPVGALPDAVTFSPDGTKVIVSNEGQPSEDYTIDPVGSISIIDVSSGAASATVTTLGFEDYNAGGSKTLPADVRVFGPGASVAQDLEPEYATVSADGSTAWVTLQENNAVAIVDLTTNTLEIKAFGFKDHSLPGNELDASDKDNKINIQNWPVKGMYMPDTISSFVVSGNTYYITANEGDARGYDAFDEEARIKSLNLDPTAFPNAAELQADEQLGRLAVTITLGDTDGDGDYDELYSFGARSFTIWNSTGMLVYDSGSDLERITASRYPAYFNLSNDDNSAGDFEARSDAKGPEPEAVAVGAVDGKLFAFVGLERIGGIAVYNVDNPQSPTFAGYFNNREFGTELTPTTGGDSGPEGLEFVSATDSPTGKALLIVGNEISG
ncbi:MAG: choice-of-anchor I family protein, partial [Deltaproteobacteria bacterium]